MQTATPVSLDASDGKPQATGSASAVPVPTRPEVGRQMEEDKTKKKEEQVEKYKNWYEISLIAPRPFVLHAEQLAMERGGNFAATGRTVPAAEHHVTLLYGLRSKEEYDKVDALVKAEKFTHSDFVWSLDPADQVHYVENKEHKFEGYVVVVRSEKLMKLEARLTNEKDGEFYHARCRFVPAGAPPDTPKCYDPHITVMDNKPIPIVRTDSRAARVRVKISSSKWFVMHLTADQIMEFEQADNTTKIEPYPSGGSNTN